MKSALKMSMMAIMVLGSISSAFAVSNENATVKFKAHMAETTCDINLHNSGNTVELGTFVKDDFPTVHNKVQGKNVAMLDLGECTGVGVPKGETISLTTRETGGSSNLHVENLFGDNGNMGVGIRLEAKTIGKAGAPGKDLGQLIPDQSVALTDVDTTNDTTVDKIALPQSLQITPFLESFALPTAMKSGDINATVVFAAEYN
ncbi:fimbrial protein [Enterobacter cloacae]|uniref:fimbrial protein n=1 Tax=Enterobacter cloacae TaxID=550 RepID=UPI0013D6C97A|nr:fimbrial protein [Enterobacter cloacae]